MDLAIHLHSVGATKVYEGERQKVALPFYAIRLYEEMAKQTARKTVHEVVESHIALHRVYTLTYNNEFIS